GGPRFTTVVSLDGSRIFVRLVALRTPIPTSTITPTPIHIDGTLRRYAAIPSPRIRIRKPTRYVVNDDMMTQGPALRTAIRKANAEPRTMGTVTSSPPSRLP